MTDGLESFWNKHLGETCLIVGNGPSLADIPLRFLRQYPSFGSNLVYKLEGFKPTYYATVDRRVMREYGEEVIQAFGDIPKFIPRPNLDAWQGENFYRFYHRPGPLWPHNLEKLWPRDLLGETGITFLSVTHVLMQLAYFMGFETMLCVGLDNHQPHNHFYGWDENAPGTPPIDKWDEGYGILAEGFKPRRVINLSTRTAVTSLERDDWKSYDKETSQ